MALHYADDRIEIDKFEVGNFENNCYVVIDPATRKALMVDAPFEPDVILEHCEGLDVERIVLTHGHGDHVQALREVRDRLGVPSGCHRDDESMMPAGPDFLVEDGDIFDVGNLRLHALHTPGHTPGGVCLFFDPSEAGADGAIHLFTGDTLFPDGPGNTRQPLGDFDRIIDSIESKLFTMPDSTAVYPGHGRDTTIGRERPQLPDWKERRW